MVGPVAGATVAVVVVVAAAARVASSSPNRAEIPEKNLDGVLANLSKVAETECSNSVGGGRRGESVLSSWGAFDAFSAVGSTAAGAIINDAVAAVSAEAGGCFMGGITLI